MSVKFPKFEITTPTDLTDVLPKMGMRSAFDAKADFTGMTKEKLVEEMLVDADRCRRETASARHLMVGLQCGGSDGFSSITAPLASRTRR